MGTDVSFWLPKDSLIYHSCATGVCEDHLLARFGGFLLARPPCLASW